MPVLHPATTRRRSRGLRRAPLIGLLAPLVLAGCAASSTMLPSLTASASAVATATAGAASVAVPVVECPTAYAGANPGAPSTTYPDTMAISATASVAGQLALYSNDTRSLSPVLAPRGWSCQVSVAVDGGVAVLVFPSTATPPSAFATLPASVTQIDAASDGACQSCIYSTVCPFVTNAGQQLGYGPGSGVDCAMAPTLEKVAFDQGSPGDTGSTIADVITVLDPAGIAGDGDPSGGTYPALGVVLYDWASSNGSPQSDGASKETCLLPSAEGGLCAAITQDFTTRAWLMPG